MNLYGNINLVFYRDFRSGITAVLGLILLLGAAGSAVAQNQPDFTRMHNELVDMLTREVMHLYRPNNPPAKGSVSYDFIRDRIHDRVSVHMNATIGNGELVRDSVEHNRHYRLKLEELKALREGREPENGKGGKGAAGGKGPKYDEPNTLENMLWYVSHYHASKGAKHMKEVLELYNTKLLQGKPRDSKLNNNSEAWFRWKEYIASLGWWYHRDTEPRQYNRLMATFYNRAAYYAERNDPDPMVMISHSDSARYYLQKACNAAKAGFNCDSLRIKVMEVRASQYEMANEKHHENKHPILDSLVVDAYGQVLELDPTNMSVNYNMAVFYYNRGVERVDAVLRLDPEQIPGSSKDYVCDMMGKAVPYVKAMEKYWPGQRTQYIAILKQGIIGSQCWPTD